MNIPLLHTFTFEYMVHMPVPKWGKGKHLYIAFHDGAVVTNKGVVFPIRQIKEFALFINLTTEYLFYLCSVFPAPMGITNRLAFWRTFASSLPPF
jgi:hypothetical protein